MQQAVKQIDDKIEVVAFEYKEPVKAVTGDDAVDWSHLPANDVIPSSCCLSPQRTVLLPMRPTRRELSHCRHGYTPTVNKNSI